jgi:hypothetical protein
MVGMAWGEVFGFRPHCIARVLLGESPRHLRFHFYLAALALMLVVVPFLTFQAVTNSGWAWFFFSEKVLPIVLCLIEVPVTFALCRNWYRGRSQLYEREHYATLFLLAALIAGFVGFLNFLLSQIDQRAFAVDTAVASTFGDQFTGDRRRLRENSQEVLASCKRIAGALRKTPNQRLPALVYQGSGDDIAQFQLEGAKIKLRSTCTGEGCVSVLSVESRPYFQILVARLPQTYADAASAIEDKAQMERRELARIDADLKNTSPHFTPSLFIYQAVMDVLQTNPNYFKPVSGAARLVAFVYGCVKFLFLSVFVVLATRSFARTPSQVP